MLFSTVRATSVFSAQLFQFKGGEGEWEAEEEWRSGEWGREGGAAQRRRGGVRGGVKSTLLVTSI